jgi:tetratricopeptide (TPR) repeat protein
MRWFRRWTQPGPSDGGTRQDAAREAPQLSPEGGQLLTQAALGEALVEFQEALAVYREAGDRAAEGTWLNNLGHVYQGLGRPEEALDHYQQALAIMREVRDRVGERRALNSVGMFYQRLGRPQEALAHLQQALTICRALRDRAEEGRVLANVGMVYRSLGRPEDALEHYQQALAISRERGDRAGEGRALNNAGVVCRSLGRSQEALEQLQQALAIMREVGDRRTEASALNNVGMIYRRLGQPQEALEHFQQAIEIAERVRGEILSEELRTSYFATVSDLYGAYVALLVEQGQTDRALHAAERGKARAFLELLAEAQAQIREGADPALLEEERSLLAQLNFTHQQLIEMHSQPSEQREAIADLRRREQELEEVLRRNQDAIKQASPKYAALTQPDIWDMGQIQDELLDEHTALLEYVLGDQQSFLFVVLKDEFEVFFLPPKEEIETLVRELRDAVINPELASYPHGHELYRALIDREVEVAGRKRRAVEIIRGKRLLIIADGVLHYLPFELLLTEPPQGASGPEPPAAGGDEPRRGAAAGGEIVPGQAGPPMDFAALSYLVRRHAIVYAPSASVAGLLKQEHQGHPEAWPQELVAFAEPELPGEEAQEKGQPVIMEAALAHTKRGAYLEPLPYTRQEVTHIAALIEPDPRLQPVEQGQTDRYDGKQVSLRLKGEATKEAVLARFDPQTNPPPTRFVHLSTHGLLDEEKPQFSGLVLSYGPSGDPFWHTFEIFNARIPADLVVLSACETGLGKVVSGEGVVGLARAFMYAGSPSVCVSLWKVPDRPTADFMEVFYRFLLPGHREDGSALGKAEALRQAQLEAIELGGPTAHPYFWAPFVLLGEWR